METTRFLLIISLGLVLMMIWQAWIEDYGYLDAQNDTGLRLETNEQKSSPAEDTNIPSLNIEESITADPVKTDSSEASKTNAVYVTTDVLDVVINTLGGTIEYAALKKYPISKKDPDKKIVLLRRNEQNNF